VSVRAMVVLVERNTGDSQVAVSRGWVIPPEAAGVLDALFREKYGEPVQEGMRDLATREDLYMGGADARP
jgi:hypothetical protein